MISHIKKPRKPAWLLDFRVKKESARRDSNGNVPEKYRKDAVSEVCPVRVSL